MALITDKITLNPKATGSAPSGTEGALYYDSDKDALYAYGTTWQKVTASDTSITGTAAGGNTLRTISGWKYHTFTVSGTFTVSTAPLQHVEIMVVSGGGGGGDTIGGGGGGGGVLIGTITDLPAAAYAITVGAVGVGATSNSQPGAAQRGGNSHFANGNADHQLIVYGASGGYSNQSHPPNPYTLAVSNGGGGNGNGSPNNRFAYGTNGGHHAVGNKTTTSFYGNNIGGKGHTHNGGHSAGGGAGAGEHGNGGQSPTTTAVAAVGDEGRGGDGYQVPWATPDALGYTAGSGAHNSVPFNVGFYFGGGGGGAQYAGASRPGGKGGGGSGISNASDVDAAGGTGGINNGASSNSVNHNTSNQVGAAGGTNTGGGGGGGAHGAGNGGPGGTGIVVVRYRL